MDRFVLADAQWAKIEPHCLGKPSDPGRSGKDNRLFVEAVLWIARTGSPWRDLPPLFGHWNNVFTRFRDWVMSCPRFLWTPYCPEKLEDDSVEGDGKTMIDATGLVGEGEGGSSMLSTTGAAAG